MMSHSRFQQKWAGVRENARKVYEFIPSNEGITYSQIHQAAQRSGMNIRVEALMACVVSLKDAGLVYESAQSRFQRVPHKPDLRVVTNEPLPAAEHTITESPMDTLDPLRLGKALLEKSGYVVQLKADYDKDQEAFVKLDDELKALKEHTRKVEARFANSEAVVQLQARQANDKAKEIERLTAEIESLKKQLAARPDPETLAWKNIGFDFEADFKALQPYQTKPYALPKGRTMSAMQQAARAGAQRAMNGETGWLDSFVEDEGSVLVVVRRKSRSTAREQLQLKAA